MLIVVVFAASDAQCKDGIKCLKTGLCLSRDICGTTTRKISYCGPDDTSDRTHCKFAPPSSGENILEPRNRVPTSNRNVTIFLT